ncbi:MAG: histidine phosphatase family protein [Acidimicrobiales bacterium]|nr:histidine phosphatase family protein [Actinomycetota bacterium]
MPILLVRHAKAGSRQKWNGPDHLRPLSKKGWDQAFGLVGLLDEFAVTRVLSSPFLRCRQTVEPLAGQRKLTVEDHEALAEGAPLESSTGLVRDLAREPVVLCSHGDVIPELLDALARTDGLSLPADYPYPKGSTWVLYAGRHGRFVKVAYLPPA